MWWRLVSIDILHCEHHILHIEPKECQTEEECKWYNLYYSAPAGRATPLQWLVKGKWLTSENGKHHALHSSDQHLIIVMCKTNFFGPINIPFPYYDVNICSWAILLSTVYLSTCNNTKVKHKDNRCSNATKPGFHVTPFPFLTSWQGFYRLLFA